MSEFSTEEMTLNMGPQHPSTHGVLRLILEIDGETITEARCGIGYLHTAIEKTVSAPNLEACRAVLEGFVDGLPAGQALQRRVGS